MKIEIPIKKRSKKEIAAYKDGFVAGIKMCHKAIDTNADSFFRALVAQEERQGEE